MDRLNISLDADGVIYPFSEITRQWFIEGEGYPEEQITPCVSWKMWEDWGISEPRFWSGVANGVRQGCIFSSGKPTEGAHDFLGQLLAEGHPIHIVTARTIPGAVLEARRATFRWLEDNLSLPWSSIVVSSNKAIMGSDVLIDDSILNCAAVMASNILPICYDQPWNHEWDGLRVKNFEEVYQMVKALDAEFRRSSPDTRTLHKVRTSTAEPKDAEDA